MVDYLTSETDAATKEFTFGVAPAARRNLANAGSCLYSRTKTIAISPFVEHECFDTLRETGLISEMTSKPLSVVDMISIALTVDPSLIGPNPSYLVIDPESYTASLSASK
jgi:hypothetical protein